MSAGHDCRSLRYCDVFCDGYLTGWVLLPRVRLSRDEYNRVKREVYFSGNYRIEIMGLMCCWLSVFCVINSWPPDKFRLEQSEVITHAVQ